MIVAKYSISPNSSKQSDFAADGHHILTPRVLAESQCGALADEYCRAESMMKHQLV